MYCAKCGAQLPDETILCDKCGFGAGIAKTNAATPYLKPCKPGKGFGISSLVLSIFGAVYAFMLLVFTLQAIGYYFSVSAADINIYRSLEIVLSNFFDSAENQQVNLYIFVSSLFSGLAFIFVLLSRKKGYKNKITKASLILCIISLAFIIIFAVFIGYAYANSLI